MAVLGLVVAATPVADADALMIPMPVKAPTHIPLDLREVDRARQPSDPDQGWPLSKASAAGWAPWTTGSAIAVAPDDALIAIADPDNEAVVLMDPVIKAPAGRIPVSGRPERLVFGPDHKIYVACRLGRAVAVIDPSSRAVEARLDAGVEPYGLGLTPDGATLVVAASATHELIAFDTASRVERYRVQTKVQWPAAVAVAPDGKRAYVTHHYGGAIEVLDVSKGTLAAKHLELPQGEANLPGRLLGRKLGNHANRKPNQAFAALVSPGGERLMVPHTMVDTGDGGPPRLVGGDGYGLGGLRPIVSRLSVIDLAKGEVSIPPPGAMAENGARHAQLSIADSTWQMLAQPVAVAHHPTHAIGFVVGQGNDTVVAFDTSFADPMVAPIANFVVGMAPRGIAISHDGSTAWVANSQSFDLSVIDLRPLLPTRKTEFVRAGYDDQRLIRAATGRADLVEGGHAYARDPLPPSAARGRRLFTQANQNSLGGFSGFACASCHPDGRQDGLVWQIGAGPRQTPILAGGTLRGTAPFNWLGTEAHLEENIQQTIKRLGGAGINDVQQRDLANYIQNYLPGLDNPHRDPALRDTIARGKAIFVDSEVGCASCHSPESAFTDGDNHDVATTTEREIEIFRSLTAELRERREKNGQEPIPEPPVAYNTPTLKNVWASAPYYHDGSQHSLRDLLLAQRGRDKMGKTSHLSPDQIDALVAYLLTL